MQAYVYKSQRKQDTYVYLATRDVFDALPAPLQAQLGPFAFVLEVTLDAGRKLARADVEAVRRELVASGFYLQLPPPPLGMPERHDD